MDRIDELRHSIDTVDNKILELLNERAKYVIEIGHLKQSEGKPLYVPSREKRIYDRLSTMNTGPFPNEGLRCVFREIISASLSLEEVQKIGFLGPFGTFTNLAGIKHFGQLAKLVPLRTIPDVFEAVVKGRCVYGIIPIENSLEGVVNHTLDMFVDSPLKIVGEVYLEVAQHLLNASGNINDIERIYSHPHAIAQCKGWLSKNLPEIPVIEVESTARAAEMAKNDATVAAIASEMAEYHYSLRPVERNIEDSVNNYTRFLVIGDMDPEPTGRDKTSLVFSVHHHAGSLYQALASFSATGINMTKIESRPARKKAWEYIFYVDIEGHRTSPEISAALSAFEKHVSFLKILGSYPKGDKE